MHVKEAASVRILLYPACGAALWGIAACLDRSADGSFVAVAVVCGALLGLFFAIVPRGRRT